MPSALRVERESSLLEHLRGALGRSVLEFPLPVT
jgi:hypothetical protein